MEKIFNKDIKERKEFAFEGDILKFTEYCEESGRYLYTRYNTNGVVVGYEVVQPIKKKNPDGNYVYVYPSTSQFGKNGWALAPNSDRNEIEYFLNGWNNIIDWLPYRQKSVTLSGKNEKRYNPSSEEK